MRATAEFLRQKYPDTTERIQQSRSEPIITEEDRAKINHFVQRFRSRKRTRMFVITGLW